MDRRSRREHRSSQRTRPCEDTSSNSSAAARGTHLVTEGRDQGTVVFPNAGCKFFLTASPEERASRRQIELQAKGEFIPLEDLLAQQAIRDQRDQTRSCSPLTPPSSTRR